MAVTTKQHRAYCRRKGVISSKGGREGGRCDLCRRTCSLWRPGSPASDRQCARNLNLPLPAPSCSRSGGLDWPAVRPGPCLWWVAWLRRPTLTQVCPVPAGGRSGSGAHPLGVQWRQTRWSRSQPEVQPVLLAWLMTTSCASSSTSEAATGQVVMTRAVDPRYSHCVGHALGHAA